MSREIKFRMWDFENLEMIDGESLAFEEYAPISNLLTQEGIMQYTGLKDKNGKEIYEGDITRSVALSNDHHQRGAIVVSPVEYWNGNACLSITYTPIYPFCIDHEIEVIGNIYANPELLEAKHD